MLNTTKKIDSFSKSFLYGRDTIGGLLTPEEDDWLSGENINLGDEPKPELEENLPLLRLLATV